MNINEVINQEISKIDTGEIVRKEVVKNMEKLIKDKISKLFDSWGEIGKKVEKHINDNLNIDLSRIKLHEHRDYVVDCISNELAKHFSLSGFRVENLINTKIFTESRAEIPFESLKKDIIESKSNDFTINLSEGRVYHCNGELDKLKQFAKSLKYRQTLITGI